MHFKAFLQESINDTGIFKVIFMAGTPGAGKSFTIKQLTSGKLSPRVVSTDKFTEFLARKFKVQLKGEMADEFYDVIKDKTEHLTKSQLKQYVNGMLPLFAESTSADIRNVVMRAGIMENLGYDVGMIFVNSKLQTAIDRVNNRERQVGQAYIKQAHKLANENKDFYKGKFDFFLELNNDEGELTDDVLRKAFKKTVGFFESPVKNPTGKRTIEQLRKTGEKFLVPTIVTDDELNKKLEGWYV